MTNQEKINNILKLLEKNHKNLYHDVSKEEIEKFVASISWNDLDDVQFDVNALKLFAKFKDAHTSYYVQNIGLDKEFICLNNKVYLKDGSNYKEIAKIGGRDIKNVLTDIKTMSNYETDAWLRTKIEMALNNFYWHKMLGTVKDNQIKCTTKQGEEIFVQTPKKVKPKRPNWYSYKFFDNILYLKYTGCADMPNYPFLQFMHDLKTDLKNHKISQFILDVRNNTGGSSEILNPFQKLVAQKKWKGVVLMNYKTFSAGRFAVGRFRKNFNATLIGEPTGGAAMSYGNCKRLCVEGKTFSASQKYFDFSDLGFTGSFLPDIEVKPTIKDIENNKDVVLETAINYLNKNKELNNEK